VPSTFKEDLAKADFLDGDGALYEYAVETAACKAREVYERLVKQDGMNPPDLVIAADTIVLKDKVILEKPRDKVDQLRMLAELNDGEVRIYLAPLRTPLLPFPPPPLPLRNSTFSADMTLRRRARACGEQQCEVITGISIIHPILSAPGFKVRSLTERTSVHFAHNSHATLQAYVDCEEGLDRAGGFAVQVSFGRPERERGRGGKRKRRR
jgi:septum formation protein